MAREMERLAGADDASDGDAFSWTPVIDVEPTQPPSPPQPAPAAASPPTRDAMTSPSPPPTGAGADGASVTATKFCIWCGTKLVQEARFCSQCGGKQLSPND